MDEKEKELLNAEEVAEEAEKAVEETVEEVVEAAEETLEKIAEEGEGVEEAIEDDVEEIEDSTEAVKYVDVEKLAKQVKSLKIKNTVLSVILAAVIVAIATFVGVKAYINYNPYNHMGYYNTSGLTLEVYAKFNNVTVEDLKKELQLPDDVKGNTYLDVVDYLIPFSVVAENYGMDVETAKQMFQVADTVTGETPFGEAVDTVPLSVYVGTGDVLAEFIEEYNLGDNVTEETLWGEVRRKVLKIQYERANAPEEEKEEEVVEDAPVAQSGNSQEITEEEMSEIMAYLENATATE